MIEKANLILINGSVYTVDKNRTQTQAVAITGDRIVFVGPNEDVESYIGPGTIITDLEGKMVPPGFVDAHAHPLEGACCGYGASGRNGGFCIMTNLLDQQQKDPDRRKKDLEVCSCDIKQIKRMFSEHGIDCDFRESGMLEVAMNEKQIKTLCNIIFLSREEIYEYTPAQYPSDFR